MADFIHLHNHTHYSLLDALNTPKDLIDAAIADGHPGVAITDHGVMYGIIEFYKLAKEEAKKKNIDFNPILGCEVYVANGSRFKRDISDGRKNYFHLLLLAKDYEGYRNLTKLASLGQTEGFYYKPRVDKELLQQYSKGLICTTACMGSLVNYHIVNKDFDTALKEAKFLKDVYGEDLYIEIQNHGLEADPLILRDAPKLASILGSKLIATNDVHYLTKEHAVAHNVHLNIQGSSSSNSGLIDIAQLRYKKPEFYFKSYQEMKVLFKDFPEALSNTLEIGEKCNVKLPLGEIAMPEFAIPVTSKASNLEDYLKELAYEGLNERFKGNLTPEIIERAEYELKVINGMGFPGYFLIVWDFIKAAREMGISVGPGRGSAAGSLVAYALKITNINPLEFSLLFERFLNPERVSMPDIDIDFNDEKRDEIINYVKQKYGENAVAMIITFGKLSTKLVLKDVGRILGIDYRDINVINNHIPVNFGKVEKLAKALELSELKWLKDSPDEKYQKLIKYSMQLEDKLRHTGIHAAGVVIAPGEITNYVPVVKNTKSGKAQSIEIATQYSMNDLESAGLLKMDFLGLKTLSIIDYALELIEKNHGTKINIDEIDYYDEKTYDLLASGNTLSIFQFESSGMAEYLKKLRPVNLEELAAMNALYRPGPMKNIPEYIERKHGRKEIEYLDPLIEPVLKTTYGILIYQEQVMELVQVIAGFSLGEADVLRRAMGKKKSKEEFAPIKQRYDEGVASKKFNSKVADKMFDLIIEFANYGFNKSHAVAYSYLAFQTAWIKAHYPAEFYAANMNAELDDLEMLVQLKDEASKFDIKLMPPNINVSIDKFTTINNTIYYGMAAIKNVGIKAVQNIMEARKEHGNFTSFYDFVSKVDTRLVNRRAIEALISSGVFDSLKNGNRAQLFAAIDSAMEYSRAKSTFESSDMDDLFADTTANVVTEPALPDISDWTETERLEKEKEFLNFYISGNPLNKYQLFIEELTKNYSDSIIACGSVASVRTHRNKKDKTIAFIQLATLNSTIECIFNANTYEKCGNVISENQLLLVRGKKASKEANNSEYDSDDKEKIVVDDAFTISDAIHKLVAGYKLWIDTNDENINKINKLYEYCQMQNSRTRLLFNLIDNINKSNKLYIADDVPIDISLQSIEALKEIFGKNQVRFLFK